MPSSLPMTRGPLPPGVYWRRRLFVLTLAATVVFLVASLLTGGSDGASEEAPVAQQAGAQTEPDRTVTVEPERERDREGRRERRRERETGPTLGPSYDPDVLVEPDGACDPSEVAITPRVAEAVRGRDVTIGLSLRSVDSPACTWRISPQRVLVRISAGDEDVWTSRECPSTIPEQSVVVRDVVATVVEIAWNTKESDDRCPAASDWAPPGTYTVAAAALGGEPAATDFELVNPTPETVAPDGEADEPSDETSEDGTSEETDRRDRQRDRGDRQRDRQDGQQNDQDVPIR